MIGLGSSIDQVSFRLLVESVKDYAIFMIDTSGHIFSWNKGAEVIKGYHENEILGSHVSIFYTQEDIENKVPELNLHMVRKTGRLETEGWRIRKDGSRFWAGVVLTALKDETGKLIGYVKMTSDLTNRKIHEDESKRLNEELEIQLSNSRSEISDYKHALDESSIVAITDQRGIITDVNNNFCRISKYSRKELIGKDHRIINSGHHSREFIRDLWVTIAKGKIWRGELKNKAKDGSFYWVDTTIVPFLNKNGKPHKYIAIRSDITQRKTAEEQIIKINEDLEKKIRERTIELTEALGRERELNEMKSRFVSIASHEFRTPLSAILSSISLIDMYKTDEQADKRKKHVERVKSSVKNLTDILEEFLSLEKLEKGKQEVQSTRFDLKDLIEDIIEDMDGQLSHRKQEVVFSMPLHFLEVWQDKKMLRNVLLNLMSNAVKYSDEGKTIHLTVSHFENVVTISVRDEGMGIPTSSQKDIFSKFFRAPNTVNIQGTGLGLNIIKKYMELMDGSIYFTSRENEGSTFTIEFPVGDPLGVF
jgi:PAS domain S-box-containing protein